MATLNVQPEISRAPTPSNAMHKAHYAPPWADMSIIGVAGASGSGKTSLAIEIVRTLNLPWVIILSIDAFYKTLSPEENRLAHNNEWDLDSPDSIDFDLLYEKLKELKRGKKTDMPLYSFTEHQRLNKTMPIYSPHVVILEGILALNDPRILEMLDMKIYVDADADLCLSRRIVRDVRERGRTIEGTIKQWFRYVKPVFLQYVDPQKEVADLIVPRGMQNKIAIQMIVNQIRLILDEKSNRHSAELEKLGKDVEDFSMPENAIVLDEEAQVRAISTIIRSPTTNHFDFAFYLDRLAAILIGKALDCHLYVSSTVTTPVGLPYKGLKPTGIVSAVVVLRGGSCLENGLKKTIPDCLTGRMLIQPSYRTGEPELHYLKLFPDIHEHKTVMLVDSQMSSGGSALMAVKILVDHGVAEENIVFVTCMAGRRGLKRLLNVFPTIKVVTANVIADHEQRWIEEKYLGC